jgi:hypothetical protein
MISAGKILASSAAFFVLFGAGLAPDAPLGLGMLPEAQAVVGAPLTPASAAGVARRTTRRTVAVTSTATAAAATPQTVVVQTAPATSGALPIGTVVAALPAGCSTMTMSGVEYYKCGPDYYRTAYQGTNLVYVTAQP